MGQHRYIVAHIIAALTSAQYEMASDQRTVVVGIGESFNRAVLEAKASQVTSVTISAVRLYTQVAFQTGFFRLRIFLKELLVLRVSSSWLAF